MLIDPEHHEIRETDVYTRWFTQLRDAQARARILTRIDRLAEGNPGQSRSVGSGVIELKIDYGPGYRVYFTTRGPILIVLLCGGDKDSQARDIEKAKELAAELA